MKTNIFSFSSTLLFLLGLGFLFVANASEKQKIEMAAGLPKPPFVIKNGQGMQLDIVKAALAMHNIEVKFVYMPFGRNIPNYRRFSFDGVITVPSHIEQPGMFVSTPYIRYQNIAVSLSENNLDISTIADLADKKVIAFQRAKKYLGEDYYQAALQARSYREVAEQEQQVSALFLKHAEVIVLDVNIFKYYLSRSKSERFNAAYKLHYIFDESYYSAGFRDQAVQKAFDDGILKLKQSGEYQKILDHYLN